MLQVVAAKRQHFFGSTINLYLSLINETTGVPITGESPTIAIRRASDGFFFNGTIFVDTSDTPTNLAMSEINATAVAGLYNYVVTDPGPVIPVAPAIQLSKDLYELHFINTGAPPVGGNVYDIREVSRELRDINTQGS